MLVGLIPGIGAILSLFHLAVLYALYSFEYKWIYQGKQACLKHKHHTVNTHFHLVLRVWLHICLISFESNQSRCTILHALVKVDDRKLH